MATPYHSQCGQVKEYNLFQCTFLTKCIQIRNRSPFLIRPSVRTGAPSPRGKAWCGASSQIPICRTLDNVSKHILNSSPKGIPHLISHISNLLSPLLFLLPIPLLFPGRIPCPLCPGDLRMLQIHHASSRKTRAMASSSASPRRPEAPLGISCRWALRSRPQPFV